MKQSPALANVSPNREEKLESSAPFKQEKLGQEELGAEEGLWLRLTEHHCEMRN